jgi:predicted DNA-binding transcriptional regulator YafY
MYQPATRVLTVLELLQAHQTITGRALAERLEVSPRTVRRYITMLQDLGIPVEADRGPQGAYRLAPGYRLPPLMFTEDEGLALILGLRVTQRLGLPVEMAAVEGALAKVDRVLPLALRARLQSVQQALLIYAPAPYTAPATKTVLTLTTASQQSRRVRLRYKDRVGVATEREFDPYGVVYYTGRWFTAGYCHLRQGLRLFRLDRVQDAALVVPAATFTRPADFDVLAHVSESLALSPGICRIEVWLDLPMSESRPRVPLELATLVPDAGGTLLRCNVQELDWFARFLVGLECDFKVRHPPELRTTLKQLAERLTRLAEEQ